MTTPGLLGAQDLQRLFAAVDTELGHTKPTAHANLVVVGGAAISLRTGNRTTQDLDIISDNMPPELFAAAQRVAQAWHLPHDWLNDGAKGFAPNLPLNGTEVYNGTNLTVTIPSDQYLLAMKLFSARDQDLPDAELLAQQTGLSTPKQLLELVTAGYAPRPINVKVQYFAEQVAHNATRTSNTGPNPERLNRTQTPPKHKPAGTSQPPAPKPKPT